MRDTGPQPEQKSEEEIIEEIIRNVEITKEEEDGIEIIEHVLKYGKKKLIIWISPEIRPQEEANATTLISAKTEGEDSPYQTRILYKCAKKIIQEHANNWQITLLYEASTIFKKMKTFFDKYGDEIFDEWDDTKVEDQIRLDKVCFEDDDPNKTFKEKIYKYYKNFNPQQTVE